MIGCWAVLSISFEVDVPTGKVGGSLLFECGFRHQLPRGVWGHAPPRKFWHLDAWKCYFQRSPDSIWAWRTIKPISLCLLQPFFSSKSQSLAFRKEWNNKSSNADSKNTFNVLSSCCPFEKTCSAMSALVSLAQMPFWQMQKPGI